ncbi:polyketide synthase [Paramyrothecium foliicola]|nr:polyketide synthase [Paramyrothecium foliicola]
MKLSDAIRDNDPIRAVVRSSCTNADGKTAGMSQPSSSAHGALMLRSHELAGLDVSKTAMIECHGTGTPVGDPLEATAIARVFGEHGVYIGSLKPNMGHSEGASGVSSTIKAMLALEHKLIPANINFHKGNPKTERVAVNSFGLSGANAHILLKSAASVGVARSVEPTRIMELHYLLILSASHQDSLRKTVQEHEAYLRNPFDHLQDLSYTLNLRREALAHRAFAVVDASAITQDLAIAPLERSGDAPDVVFIFTGQGAQWPTMGSELLQSNETFRQSVALMDQALRQYQDPPTWTIREDLEKGTKTSLVGRSSGEVAAAYASGALNRDAAILAACHRGVVTRDVNSRGAMAAVGLGRATVEPYLKAGIVVGCENSPSSVTLSGDEDAVIEVLETIKEAFPNAAVRQLRVDCVYHSPHMQEVEATYRSKIAGLATQRPRITFFSSVTESLLEKKPDADYWTANLTSPELFSTAVSALVKSQGTTANVLCEIGPHSALAGPVRQILQASGAKKITHTGSFIRSQPALQALLATAGRLFQLRKEVDWESIVSRGHTLVDLPL